MIHTITAAPVAAEKLTGTRLPSTGGETRFSRPVNPHPDGSLRLSGQPSKLLLRGIALAGGITAQERPELIRSLQTPRSFETQAGSNISRAPGELLSPGAVPPNDTVCADQDGGRLMFPKQN